MEKNLDTLLTMCLDKKYITLSFIQGEYGVGFNKARELLQDLINKGYACPTNKKEWFLLDQDKIHKYLGVEKPCELLTKEEQKKIVTFVKENKDMFLKILNS